MRTTAISSIISIENQRLQALSIKIFAAQFKCTGREKFSVFVLKGAISGPHLTYYAIICFAPPANLCIVIT